MVTFQEFKKQAEITGVNFNMIVCIQEEYLDAIQEARSEHKPWKHLQEEYNKIHKYWHDKLSESLNTGYKITVKKSKNTKSR